MFAVMNTILSFLLFQAKGISEDVMIVGRLGSWVTASLELIVRNVNNLPVLVLTLYRKAKSSNLQSLQGLVNFTTRLLSYFYGCVFFSSSPSLLEPKRTWYCSRYLHLCL